MSEIISTVVVAIHPSLDVEKAIAAFSSTYVQNDMRVLPNTTPEQVADAAAVAYANGEDNIVYLPFDVEVINATAAREVPVAVLIPTPDLHMHLTDRTGGCCKAYETAFEKYKALDVAHVVIAEDHHNTPLMMLHNVFNTDQFGF